MGKKKLQRQGVKIGFVCGKGQGHLQLVGEEDYGVCGTKTIAEVFVTVVERDDLHPDYRDLVTAEDVAQEIQEIVKGVKGSTGW